MWVEETGAELPSRISLFQGLPKADKMELVIQKAVELGAYELVPMATRRAVVKLDAKRGGKAQAMECNFRERGEAVETAGLFRRYTVSWRFGRRWIMRRPGMTSV